MPTGTPASGPTVFPAMMSASIAFACARATSGDGVQKAPSTGLSLSIRASTASVTSVAESCLVRIFSASVTASMRQISFAGTAAAAGVRVAAIAPATTVAAPAATMNSRRDTPSSALHVPVMGFLLEQLPGLLMVRENLTPKSGL